jgi:hypothetical protein
MLEPVLEPEGAGAQEYESKEAAIAEAKARLKDDDVDRTYVLERRVVEEYVANREGQERAAVPVTQTYQVNEPAGDLALAGNPDYVDVICPCGGKTGFSRGAVKQGGEDGLIGKCLRCQRHFKLGVADGALKVWNVSLVPVG